MTSLWEKCWNALRLLPEAKALRLGIAYWLIFGAIVGGIVAADPDRHTATLEYQYASQNWWKDANLYQKKQGGYLYLPHHAILYTPYILVPKRVGEPLWRLTILFLLAFAVWKATGAVVKNHHAATFLAASILLLPSALSSARNGQVNMPLAALFLLCAVTLSEKKWIFSTVLLLLCLALKPISVVPILICIVLYPRMRIPLIVGLIVLFFIPFLHPHPAYVWDQYHVFVDRFLRAGKPTGHTWCDFAGMLRTFGVRPSDMAHLAIRAFAALVALWAAWRAVKIQDVFRSVFTIMLVSVIYLMLFNPRTETNSYVMLGAFIGVWGAYEGLIARRLGVAGLLAAFAILLGVENYGGWIFHATDHWSKAFLTCVLLGWLLVSLFQAPAGQTVVMKEANVDY